MVNSVLAGIVTTTLEAGALAPDFTVTDTDGATLRLSEMVTQGPVVLAFFPKAFTGG
jgi:peroxiredoxin